MQYQNVINKPLLVGEPDTKTLDILNIPELHIMTGVVGKLITELENQGFETKQKGQTFVNGYLEREDIARCVYQGSRGFEGNQAHKLLMKIDILERDIMKMDPETIIKSLPFVQCLRKFEKVVTACFGQTLDLSYGAYIDEFSTTYRSLDISVTPKVHIVERHVSEFLKLKGETTGLGFWSEQSMEAGHHDFKMEWEKVKVSPNHKEYAERLFKTVVRYNGKHL